MILNMILFHYLYVSGIDMMKMKRLLWKALFISSLLPFATHASFIEATIGTAIVNDATATYFNPASLTLLKNPQLIGSGSIASFNTNFSGRSLQRATGFTQTGTTSSQTHYYLPEVYAAVPINQHFTMGLAVISNYFTRDLDSGAILRYVQSGNTIQDIDFVPAIGMRLSDKFSFGIGVNFSHADFLLKPLFGIPGLNLPDSQSRNNCDGNGVGGDAGFLFKAGPAVLVGFDYRSAISYKLNGRSILFGTHKTVSNHYGFTFWTPARSVLSVGWRVTPCFGLVGTLTRIQWSILNNVHVHGIATPLGIVNASIPFHLNNAWVMTLASQYRLTPAWVVRFAGSYEQSAGNRHLQIANGDSIIVGGSMGYDLNKCVTIDGSYAHVFIKNENINIVNSRNIIRGKNKGFRNGVTLKLTVNM